eukprot:comp13542_c0_seq1/m.9113 comp13542_c0_seq1/g.9113  ORF comp13542_c0_seq1/g.9113 comp13542_c0_seq1/m.9113 type:complete len:493 (-) comp13542_c0_seq1:647-2125(-)
MRKGSGPSSSTPNTQHDHNAKARSEKVCASETCDKVATKKCARCRLVRYCSAECQRDHFPEHKLQCVVEEDGRPKKERKAFGTVRITEQVEKELSDTKEEAKDHPQRAIPSSPYGLTVQLVVQAFLVAFFICLLQAVAPHLPVIGSWLAPSSNQIEPVCSVTVTTAQYVAAAAATTSASSQSSSTSHVTTSAKSITTTDTTAITSPLFIPSKSPSHEPVAPASKVVENQPKKANPSSTQTKPTTTSPSSSPKKLSSATSTTKKGTKPTLTITIPPPGKLPCDLAAKCMQKAKGTGTNTKQPIKKGDGTLKDAVIIDREEYSGQKVKARHVDLGPSINEKDRMAAVAKLLGCDVKTIARSLVYHPVDDSEFHYLCYGQYEDDDINDGYINMMMSMAIEYAIDRSVQAFYGSVVCVKEFRFGLEEFDDVIKDREIDLDEFQYAVAMQSAYRLVLLQEIEDIGCCGTKMDILEDFLTTGVWPQNVLRYFEYQVFS